MRAKFGCSQTVVTKKVGGGYTQTERQRDRETDRQTDSQTARQPDSQTDRQTDKQTDRQTYIHTDRQTHIQRDAAALYSRRLSKREKRKAKEKMEDNTREWACLDYNSSERAAEDRQRWQKIVSDTRNDAHTTLVAVSGRR